MNSSQWLELSAVEFVRRCLANRAGAAERLEPGADGRRDPLCAAGDAPVLWGGDERD